MVLCLQVFISKTFSQELYVFTEPASNMPARSLAVRTTARLASFNPLKERYMPEGMLGISKQLMMHISGTFSDYYSNNLRAESVKLYAKYRFFSSEDVHKHFRIAAFGDVSFTRSPYQFEEVSLEGDNSGFQAGFIATQLVNKLALSSTIGYTKIFNAAADKLLLSNPAYNFFSYTLSAGYLVLPKEYKNYEQTNLNAYVEFLSSKSMDNSKYNIESRRCCQREVRSWMVELLF